MENPVNCVECNGFWYPNLHCHHINEDNQGDVLQSNAKATCQSPLPIQLYKVKSHAGIIGGEYADAIARKSVTTYSVVADTEFTEITEFTESECATAAYVKHVKIVINVFETLLIPPSKQLTLREIPSITSTDWQEIEKKIHKHKIT
jgi:hypothetical protein